MNAVLFDLAFYFTVPFWALMILAPKWAWTHRIVSSPLIVLPTVAVWIVLAVPMFPELWAAVSNPSLAGFGAFLADDAAVALVWAQIIAWDLFLGRWVYLRSRELDMHPLLMGPLLALLILLSPLVLPVFLVLRARARRRAPADA